MAYTTPSSGAYTDFSAYLRANPNEAPRLAQSIYDSATSTAQREGGDDAGRQAESLSAQINTLGQPGAAASYLPGQTGGERSLNSYLLGGDRSYLPRLQSRYGELLDIHTSQERHANTTPVIANPGAATDPTTGEVAQTGARGSGSSANPLRDSRSGIQPTPDWTAGWLYDPERGWYNPNAANEGTGG